MNIAHTSSQLASIYRIVRPVLPLVIAAGLLAALVTRINVGDVWAQLTSADPRWLPLIIAALYASDWFRAVRWQHLLSPLRRPGLLLLFAAAQLGSAVSLLLPIRASEAVRVRIISQRTGISAASLVGTIFGEIMSDLLVFAVYTIVGILFLKEARFLWPLALVCALLVASGGAGAYYLAGRAERRPKDCDVTTRGLRAWLSRELHNFASGLQPFRDPTVMFHVIWGSQGIWLCEVVLFYASGRALGLDLSPGAYLLILVVATVAGSVAIAQSGFGVFEVTLTGLIVALGPDQAQAAAYAIFVHVLLTFPHIISGPLAALALRINPATMLFGEAGQEQEARPLPEPEH